MTKPQPASLALVALAAALPFATGCASQPKPEPAAAGAAPARHLGPPAATITEATHSELRRRMQRHAQDMNELVWAVVLLDYGASQKSAEAIAADAELDQKAMEDAADAAKSLPKGFFTLQAELRSKSADLARAAAVSDAKNMAAIYGSLSQVCIDCHAVYRGQQVAAMPPSAQ